MHITIYKSYSREVSEFFVHLHGSLWRSLSLKQPTLGKYIFGFLHRMLLLLSLLFLLFNSSMNEDNGITLSEGLPVTLEFN